jgi:UDP-glucose 4-epimerase
MEIPGINYVNKLAVNAFENYFLPVAREIFWTERFTQMPFSSKVFFGAWENFFKLGQIKFFRDIMPEFNPEKTNMSWIPINQTIEGMQEIALPELILDKLIDKASHRVIVNYCGCRKVENCQSYPHDIGCLMMGESALLIPEKVRKEVDADEAKAHVRKAVANGLIPITGKARIDNDLFLIPDEDKLLTVCFCCECCCITRFTKHIPSEHLDQMFHPIEGLSIEVTDECIGCGKCESKCYVEAIKVVNEKAVISDKCRICGRCVSACPTKAIRLIAKDPDAAEAVIQRIDSVVMY